MNRFRPNLVVAGGGPWEEERWAAVRVADAGAAGEAALEFAAVKPCSRCKVGLQAAVALARSRGCCRRCAAVPMLDAAVHSVPPPVPAYRPLGILRDGILAAPCRTTRCPHPLQVTTIDQATAEEGLEPLVTLKDQHSARALGWPAFGGGEVRVRRVAAEGGGVLVHGPWRCRGVNGRIGAITAARQRWCIRQAPRSIRRHAGQPQPLPS